jgi:hypothetical protein
VSPAQLAGILYDTLRTDTSAVAALRNEAATLAQAIGTNPEKCREITSATVNGQSYGAQVSMNNLQRLAMLRAFLAGVDAGVRPSTRTYACF